MKRSSKPNVSHPKSQSSKRKQKGFIRIEKSDASTIAVYGTSTIVGKVKVKNT